MILLGMTLSVFFAPWAHGQIVGTVTTLAGSRSGGPPNNYGSSDGFASAASFYNPWGVAVAANGSWVLVVSYSR